jgi:NAD(P)-dependent dehydrogenase (short-subunit alcohol dehydrogenase family)
VLVNNAAIRREVPLGHITREQFDEVLAVNLAAPLFASQAAIPHMERRGGGRIINIASQFGRVTYKGRALYGMSKAALIHLTKSMAYELAPKGILVNAVSPGPIHTARTEARMTKDPEEVARQLRELPVGRLGRPDEVAEIVLFLATTTATFLTGEDICVDGGYTIH